MKEIRGGSGKLTDRIVHGLVDGRSHPAPLVAERNDLRDLKSRIVAQSKLHEFALLVQLVNGFEGLLKRNRTIGGVKVEDVNLVGLKFLQRQFQVLTQDIRLMRAGLFGIPLGRNGQPTLLPFGLRCEGFLGASDVDSGRVDLIVPLLLEIVQALVELVQRGDPGAFGLVRTKGHQPENHSGLRTLCNERH